jgi:ferredoxin
VDAIAFKPHEKHEVDNELCIKCDGCRQVCPEDAVITIIVAWKAMVKLKIDHKEVEVPRGKMLDGGDP